MKEKATKEKVTKEKSVKEKRLVNGSIKMLLDPLAKRMRQD